MAHNREVRIPCEVRHVSYEEEDPSTGHPLWVLGGMGREGVPRSHGEDRIREVPRTRAGDLCREHRRGRPSGVVLASFPSFSWGQGAGRPACVLRFRRNLGHLRNHLHLLRGCSHESEILLDV